MVAPSYNKKKSALVKITKGNALSKKKKIALKKKHDKNKTLQSGENENWEGEEKGFEKQSKSGTE